MTDAKKFLFDKNDFGELKEKPPVYTEEQLVMAKNHSFAAGKAEGLKEARQQQEERIADLLQKTLAAAKKLVDAEDRRETEKCIAAAELAMRVTHRLLPQFSQQHALPEIERVITQAIETRRDEPRLAVTVPTAHLEALKGRVDSLALEKGYGGRVILLADDALGPGDCRVEWADGGAERLYERLFAQVETEFTKAIACMNAALGQKTEATPLTAAERKNDSK